MNLSSRRLDGPLQTTRSRKKRDSLEIISQMLEAASQGSRKTGIMYRANLSYELLIQYMSVLVENQFLETPDNRTFFLTMKGRRFLKEFREFGEICDTYNAKALIIKKLFE